MDSANKTDKVDICWASMVNLGIGALVTGLDFGQSMVVALVEDDAKLAAMDHFVVEVLPVEVAVASIETSVFEDRAYSLG